MKLEDISVHAWLQEYNIKNEKGEVIDFYDHRFLFQPYSDLSAKQVYLKAAQIGASTMQVIKSLWLAAKLGMNIIYTLPTDSDVQEFAGGKVNPIIHQNPILQRYVKDKDSVEQKRVGNATIYYRGAHSDDVAIMVTSDANMYDEVDASKQANIEQYSSRLQHSKFKWEHYFSHPSTDGYGVSKYWELSDQKHWMITCGDCGYEQFMDWPASVNEAGFYQCKDSGCGGTITDDMRRNGRWVAKYKDRAYSGYWIPLLICPWVPATEILQKFHEKPEDYFWNKVLGKAYVGGGNKLTKGLLMRNLTEKQITPTGKERVVIGIDTGKKIHYVCGTKQGLFYYGECTDYAEIDELMERWPKAIIVIDQGGDLIGSRALRERYVGRVFLCTYGEDRKTMELVRWGQKDENGNVVADRNRMIQLVVSEFTDKRIPIMGNENDWYDYWLHWNALTRISKENERGQIKKEWIRNGADHWAHCLRGDTLITTKNGDIPIKDIKIGNEVLTRKGYKKVLNAWMDSENAEVMELQLSNGKNIVGTPNHRFWTQDGWKELQFLTTYDILEEWNNKHSMGEFINSIRARNTLWDMGITDYIGSYGSFIMGKCRKVIIFTTEIIIRSIMTSRIWNYLKDLIIFPITQNQNRLTNPHALYVQSQLIGTIPRIINTVQLDANPRYTIKNIIKSTDDALSVELDSPHINTLEVKPVQKYVRVVKSVRLKERISVYNLSVKDEHEYYANGFLTANSTTYWRIGMMRFGGKGGVIRSGEDKTAFDKMRQSPTIAPDGTIPVGDVKKIFIMEDTKNYDAD